jgi:hypothetical protein
VARREVETIGGDVCVVGWDKIYFFSHLFSTREGTRL